MLYIEKSDTSETIIIHSRLRVHLAEIQEKLVFVAHILGPAATDTGPYHCIEVSSVVPPCLNLLKHGNTVLEYLPIYEYKTNRCHH